MRSIRTAINNPSPLPILGNAGGGSSNEPDRRHKVDSALVVGGQGIISVGLISLLQMLCPQCKCNRLQIHDWLVGEYDHELATSDLTMFVLTAEVLADANTKSKLSDLCATTRVIVITAEPIARQDVELFIKIGLAGCLLLGDEIESIQHALALIRAGHRYFDMKHLSSLTHHPHAIGDMVSSSATRMGKSRTSLPLSQRQKDVAKLLMKGASNKEISRTLGISIGTAKNYVADILLMLGVSSRAKAVARLVSFITEDGLT